MPWCARCGTGISQMEMNEGYRDREDPGPDGPLPARRPARGGAARLDDDALDADLERRRGGRSGPALRPGPPGRRRVLAGQGDPEAGARRPVRGPRGAAGQRARRLALRGPVRRAAGRPDGVRQGHLADRRPGDALRASGRRLGRGRRGRGHRHRPHRAGLRRRGLPARQGARPAGDRAARRERASTSTASGSLTGRDVRDVADPIVERPASARAASTASSRIATATRTAGAAARRSSSASSTSGTSRWARSTTSRAQS